ncbi:MAG: hypothetical protein HOD16_06770 [Nitrospina sp.]|nr:hypothetical protein [Nitrospina sp.]
METTLENIIGVIEATWSKLATLLNLEEMGTLDALQPILAKILSDPLLLGLTLAIITIIPYTIYKVKNAYAEKEKRLDALLRELGDEENSEDADISKPLSQNQSTKDSSPEEQTKEPDSKTYGDEFESPSSEKTTATSEDLRTPQEIFKNRRISDDDFGWETTVEEWSELYDYISKPFQADKPKQEGEPTTVPQKSEETVAASEDLRTPQEIFKNRRIADDDFGWETTVEEWDELYDYISKPFQTDKQTAVSSGNEAPPESKEELSTEPVPKEGITTSVDQVTETTAGVSADIDALANQIIEEAISKDETTEESSNMGIDELAELIEEKETVLDANQTNETLASGDKITLDIDPTTESISEESSNIGIDELAELIEEEELSTSQVEASTASVPSTLEAKPLEFDEATAGLSASETKSSPPIPKRVELTLEDVESSHEPKPVLQTIATESSRSDSEAPSAGSLLNSMLDSSVSAKTDALVSRLKTFQSELETRFQSLEQEPEITEETAPTETLRKKQGNYQPAKVSYKSKRKSRSNKEYLRQLESFIFIARQKSKSTDA